MFITQEQLYQALKGEHMTKIEALAALLCGESKEEKPSEGVRYYSVKEVAKRYAVDVATVRSWKRKKLLSPSLMLPRERNAYRFSEEDLKRFEEKHSIGGTHD